MQREVTRGAVSSRRTFTYSATHKLKERRTPCHTKLYRGKQRQTHSHSHSCRECDNKITQIHGWRILTYRSKTPFNPNDENNTEKSEAERKVGEYIFLLAATTTAVQKRVALWCELTQIWHRTCCISELWERRSQSEHESKAKRVRGVHSYFLPELLLYIERLSCRPLAFFHSTPQPESKL